MAVMLLLESFPALEFHFETPSWLFTLAGRPSPFQRLWVALVKVWVAMLKPEVGARNAEL